MAYDEADRLVEVTDARKKVYTSVYQDGALTEVRLPSNNGSGGAIRHTNFLYDLAGRVSEIKRDNGTGQETRVKYEYTEFSQIEKLVRLQGTAEHAYQFTYDALGRSLSVEDPLAALVQTDWESACPGHTLISAREITRAVEVDNLCRVFKVEASLPSQFSGPILQETRQFEYDELGRLVKAVQISWPSLYNEAIAGLDPYGNHPEERLYEYDSLDRLVKLRVRTDDNPAGTNDRIYDYEYDSEGNLTLMRDPDGRVTRYEYYRDNLLHKVKIERQSIEVGVFTYFYDAAGRLEQIDYPSDSEIKAIFKAPGTPPGPGSGWDENGNLLHLRYEKDGFVVRRFQFTYDDSNNRASMLEERADGSVVKWEYLYDWLDRLETVKMAMAESVGTLPTSLPTMTVYTYDKSDNRTGLRLEQEDLSYRYELDEASNLKKIFRQEGSDPEVLIETFESDPDGNMISRTDEITGETIRYTWSGFDRLLKVQSEDNGLLTSTAKEINRYDINGIRKRKMDKNGNGSSEFAASISTLTSKPLSSTSAAPVLSYVMGHQILGAEVNGNFQYFLTDALGTVRDVVDETGDVIQSFEFNEHGIPMDGSGAMPGTFAPKTYQGALSVNDDRNDSGLYLMGHRHYAPDLGRFISRDPIGFAGGLNLYAGHGLSPVTLVDPNGTEALVYFVDGTVVPAYSARSLAHIIQGAECNSIKSLVVRGHGGTMGTTLNGSTAGIFGADSIDAVWSHKQGAYIPILTGHNPNGKDIRLDFSKLLEGKLAKKSGIYINSCSTGLKDSSSQTNLAQVLSGAFPDAVVRGVSGSLDEFEIFGTYYETPGTGGNIGPTDSRWVYYRNGVERGGGAHVDHPYTSFPNES